MPKKLKVNKDACLGCGLCVSTYPEAFAFDDDGKATVVGEVADESAEEAKSSCPAGAISD
jgi:ferredoxin